MGEVKRYPRDIGKANGAHEVCTDYFRDQLANNRGAAELRATHLLASLWCEGLKVVPLTRADDKRARDAYLKRFSRERW